MFEKIVPQAIDSLLLLKLVAIDLGRHQLGRLLCGSPRRTQLGCLGVVEE